MKCPRCRGVTYWQRNGLDELGSLIEEVCGNCGWSEGDAETAPCIDPDCGQVGTHADSCALGFGPEFAQRADEEPVK